MFRAGFLAPRYRGAESAGALFFLTAQGETKNGRMVF